LVQHRDGQNGANGKNPDINTLTLKVVQLIEPVVIACRPRTSICILQRNPGVKRRQQLIEKNDLPVRRVEAME